MTKDWETAMSKGDVGAASALLTQGVDINSRNRFGHTGLMIDAKNGHVELVHNLARAGADLNVTAKYNLSALMLAVINGHEDVAAELVRAGADKTIRGSGAPGFQDKTAYRLAADRSMTGVLASLQ
jgi:ankyrin repeat protein